MGRLKYLFTVSKDEKVTEKCFRRILLSSALGILLCMTCLISTTWALFTSTVVSRDNAIEMGVFQVSVDVVLNDAEQVPSENAYTYALADTGRYTVNVKNTGTAKGYCEVTIGTETATTGTLTPGMDVSFSVEVYEVDRGGLKVIPHWGADPYLRDWLAEEYTLGEKPAEPTTEESVEPSAEESTEPSTEASAESSADGTDTDGQQNSQQENDSASEETGKETESTQSTEDTAEPVEE